MTNMVLPGEYIANKDERDAYLDVVAFEYLADDEFTPSAEGLFATILKFAFGSDRSFWRAWDATIRAYERAGFDVAFSGRSI